jgi:hypothetical protein
MHKHIHVSIRTHPVAQPSLMPLMVVHLPSPGCPQDRPPAIDVRHVVPHMAHGRRVRFIHLPRPPSCHMYSTPLSQVFLQVFLQALCHMYIRPFYKLLSHERKASITCGRSLCDSPFARRIRSAGCCEGSSRVQTPPDPPTAPASRAQSPATRMSLPGHSSSFTVNLGDIPSVL